MITQKEKIYNALSSDERLLELSSVPLLNIRYKNAQRNSILEHRRGNTVL